MPELDPLHTPLQGRYLLEASAGTGKTYTLALLFLRLLLEEKLAIDQILVLTFTRAATAELRDRIRGRLREALDHLEGRSKADDHLAELLQGISDPKTPQRLNQAIIRMDEAAIHTIHGFCQRMLGDYALESGSAFTFTLDPDEQELRRELIEDFWRTRFYGADEQSQENARRAAARWQEPAKLLAALGPLNPAMEILVLPLVDQEEHARLEGISQRAFVALRELWHAKRAEIADILCHNKWLNRNAYREKAMPALLRAVDELIAAEHRPARPLDSTLEKLRASVIASKLKKNAVGPRPEHPFFELFDQFFPHHNDALELWRVQMTHAARDYVLQELPRRKEASQTLSFDDLLRRLDEALHLGKQGRDLALTLSRRFPAMLIDEFQDTDPMQYRILSTIHKAAGHSLFLIGDPKQAIYSFRGADIFTYIRARRETPAERLLSMSVNHRSSAAMVAAVNSVFSHRDKAFIFSQDIPFHPALSASTTKSASGLSLNGELLAPVQILSSRPDNDTDTSLLKEEAREASARACARVIRFLINAGACNDSNNGERLELEGRAVMASDIAILVRSNHEARIMEAALRKLELAAIVCDQSSVFAAPEARQLCRVLEALADPAAKHLVRAALATELFALSAPELYRLRDEEKNWENWMRRMLDYQRLWRERGVLALLVRIFAEHGLSKRLSAEIGGERRLTNYLHLAELLQESPAASSSLAAQCRRLRLCIQQANHHAEDQLIRLESESNLIRILTIHRAKGLEFPLVFLPFAWNGPNTRNKEQCRIFHQRQPLRRILDLNGSHPEGRQLAQEENLAEELRLFYVAITRAKHCCFLACGRVNGMEGSPLGYLLHQGAKPADEITLRQDLEALNKPDEAPILSWWREREPGTVKARKTSQEGLGSTLGVKKFDAWITPAWITTSYSRLLAGAEREEGFDEIQSEPLNRAMRARPQEVDFTDILAFPQGPDAGTCLHNILEQLDFRVSATKRHELIGEQLRAAGIDLNWTRALSHWLDKVLATPLPRACPLCQLAPKDRINEFSFLFSLKNMDLQRFNAILREAGYPPAPTAPGRLNGLMKGFIDLLFRFQGRYYLADYKSNHLGMAPSDYAADKLEAAMREHNYHLQALIYTVALRRFLRLRLAWDESGDQWQEHFGGVFYLFLRGMDPELPGNGMYTLYPEESLIARLDACCGGAL